MSVKEFVEAWAPHAAILGFIAQAITLVVFVSGLKQLGLASEQLKLAKRALSVTNERAAKERALEYHDIFLTRVMPAVVKARTALAAEGAPATYEGAVGDFSPSSLSAEAIEGAKKRYLQGLDGLNLLEFYAVAHTSGVADEALGFALDGRLFCAYVATSYDLIAVVRSDPGFDVWEPLVDLYRLWSQRLTKTELENERSKVEAQLAGLVNLPPVTPIGVDLPRRPGDAASRQR